MALPNAKDFADMQANSRKVQEWKDRIEKNMLLLIENNSQDRKMAFTFINAEDYDILYKHIVPWLIGLKYNAEIKQECGYNSLIIRW